MKRIHFIFIGLVALLWTAACSHDSTIEESINQKEQNSSNNGSNENESGSENTPADSIGKILIVYFSRAGENWNVGYVDRGNTAIMGDYIKELTGGNVFEIEPENPYPTDYQEMLEVSNNETENNARPAIKNKLENLDQYSFVFIGSPIWHGNPPMIMRTFYETYSGLNDKTLIAFGTHGGSGISSCTRLIKEYFPDAIQLESYGISGEVIRDEQSKENVRAWLQRIGILTDE